MLQITSAKANTKTCHDNRWDTTHRTSMFLGNLHISTGTQQEISPTKHALIYRRNIKCVCAHGFRKSIVCAWENKCSSRLVRSYSGWNKSDKYQCSWTYTLFDSSFLSFLSNFSASALDILFTRAIKCKKLLTAWGNVRPAHTVNWKTEVAYNMHIRIRYMANNSAAHITHACRYIKVFSGGSGQ